VQEHELPFALCVVVDIDSTRLCEQYAIVRKHTTMAKNVDNKTLMRMRTSYIH
jgi:hypothetical protein